MTSNTVDELGQAVLEAIAEDRLTGEGLESRLDASRVDLDERLSQLTDNGLIREVSDERYELTENGRRVLAASPAEAFDDRVETPAHVERAIDESSLRPDEEAAVRSAFSFLRYWGEATAAELVDGVYSEVPAGYGSADRWWDECVSDRLESLPNVARSPEETSVERWRYEGPAVIETGSDRDGRNVDDPNGAPSSFGSVRHALEQLELRASERVTARVAFAALFELGEATIEELLEHAEDEPIEARAERLSATLAALPGVERESTEEDGTVLTYDPSVTE